MKDLLSTALSSFDARCDILGGIRAGGDWALRFEAEVPLKLEVVTHGSCWHLDADGKAVRLDKGDAVVLNGAGRVTLCSDPSVPALEPADIADRIVNSYALLGDESEVGIVAAHIDAGRETEALLRSALPPVLYMIARTEESTKVRRLLEEMVDEHHSARPGAAFAMAQYAQLLLLDVLRTALRRHDLTQPGLISLLADPQLRAALTAMLDDPGRAWTLTELADLADMSRSHFAHRFRETAGRSPISYLARWRIGLAEQALRTTETTIMALALRLGYASESSFSHAFTRAVGISPSRYRQRSRLREPIEAYPPLAEPAV